MVRVWARTVEYALTMVVDMVTLERTTTLTKAANFSVVRISFAVVMTGSERAVVAAVIAVAMILLVTRTMMGGLTMRMAAVLLTMLLVVIAMVCLVMTKKQGRVLMMRVA